MEIHLSLTLTFVLLVAIVQHAESNNDIMKVVEAGLPTKRPPTLPPLNVNGGWSNWVSDGCSKSCGSGIETRTRKCTNPSPSGSGAECVGEDAQETACNTFPCPSGNDTMKPPYKKPVKCQIKQPCCEPGELTVNLGSKKFYSLELNQTTVLYRWDKINSFSAKGNIELFENNTDSVMPKKKQTGSLKGVTVGSISRPKKNSCSQTVLITADFERIDNESCFGCLKSPYCGRRMLKIELELSNAGRSGWLFNIGDSQSNDGHRGDSNHQKNDAEVQGLFPSISVYPSDKCMHIERIMHIIDAISPSVHTVTLYVSNEHVRITNNEGLDYNVCSACLFALNGQSDDGPIGVKNERVYIGLNRVVAGLFKVGNGVCSATLTWVCPWCD